MAKLTAEGHKLLPTGQYVLEVVEAKLHDGYGPQLKLKLAVATGEHEGFEFTDYSKLTKSGSIKVGSKAAEIFEACLNTRITPNDDLDTDDLVAKRFQAMVSMKKSGKGNRVEHGTIGLYRPKKVEPEQRPPSKVF